MAEVGMLERGIAAPGYRLPDATTIGRVRLQVADLARSLRYYEETLGFTRLGGEGPVALLGPASGEPVVELHERPGAAPVPRHGRLGLYHFAVLLPDRASLGRFLAHLARIRLQVGMSDHLVSEAIYLRDPDGLGIEVYADRPRSSWRYDGREIAMTTMPLDVEDLLRAGTGDDPDGDPASIIDGGAADGWQMPPGTRVGHVHLHVGDLEEAAAFYHAALGLDEVVWSYPGALFLSAGGYHHHLGVNTWAAGAPRAGDGDSRLLEWELLLPGAADVAAAARSLSDAGHDAVVEGSFVRVEDPWGTGLRLRAQS